jgi:hypothetical protein
MANLFCMHENTYQSNMVDRKDNNIEMKNEKWNKKN